MNYEAGKKPELEDLLGRLQGEEDWPVLKEDLVKEVQYLIGHQFESLLQLLYRVDVPEQEFQAALKEGEGAIAERIARLLADRQLQKMRLRGEMGKRPGPIPDEERW